MDRDKDRDSKLREPVEPTEDDVLAFVDWLEKRPALDDHPLAILEWAWARFQGCDTEKGEPDGWITEAMVTRLRERGWTEGRIWREPRHDGYVPFVLRPGPVQEAPGE